jgi:hypothetical protein
LDMFDAIEVAWHVYWFSLNWRESGRVQATLGLG